jgi:hypothetical protein
MQSPENTIFSTNHSVDDEAAIKRRSERSAEIKRTLDDPGYKDFVLIGSKNKKFAAQLASDELRRNELLIGLQSYHDFVTVTADQEEIAGCAGSVAQTKNPSTFLGGFWRRLIGK